MLLTNGSAFAWLPKNGSKLIDINVPYPDPRFHWSNVTGIQWDGKFFAVDHTGVYHISLIHGQAYNLGETSLSFGGASPSGPYWIV